MKFECSNIRKHKTTPAVKSTINSSFVKGQPGRYFNQVQKSIKCEDLFTNENFDKLSEYDEPPTEIPRYA